ncbi:4-hydroxy-tetrahydrodipicolinate reductase [uncultured archaeon]|nr:4-hydroxy-tetrahydrodipicolinate reductase [uncultured archaeon]
MINVALFGSGRMGRAITRTLADCKDMKLVLVFTAPGTPDVGKDMGVLAGLPSGENGVIIQEATDVAQKLKKSKVNVAVDFTEASAATANMTAAASAGCSLVIGTTGFTPEQRKAIEDAVAKNNVGAVISPNFSVGVNVFWKLLEEAAKKLPSYDVEIVEAHHKFKKDAPSGTAMKSAEVIAKALGRDLKTSAVYGRQGLSPRKTEDIAILAVRGGDIVGDHTAYYITVGERIEITHRAHGREAFASGIPPATRYITKNKGTHTMADVLNLN